jgi:hypothetical protein
MKNIFLLLNEFIHLPILAFKNLFPIRESSPTAFATSLTDAPVASQTAEMVLILEIRCAKNALATYKHQSSSQLNLIK